jgi:hypothetical protein
VDASFIKAPKRKNTKDCHYRVTPASVSDVKAASPASSHPPHPPSKPLPSFVKRVHMAADVCRHNPQARVFFPAAADASPVPSLPPLRQGSEPRWGSEKPAGAGDFAPCTRLPCAGVPCPPRSGRVPCPLTVIC